MNKKVDPKTTMKNSELLQFIILTIILLGFWLILSGLFKPKFLIIGLVSSLIVAWLSRPLMRLNSTTERGVFYLAFNLPYLKYLAYWFWLLGEIIKSNIYLVKLVLDPRMPIDPRVVTFRRPMSNPVAHVTLANSITLTPGTVTINVEDGVYYVHAITEKAALDTAPLDGREGDMARRVAELFGEQKTGAREGVTS